jgi:hypothetical protein
MEGVLGRLALAVHRREDEAERRSPGLVASARIEAVAPDAAAAERLAAAAWAAAA